MAVRRDRKRSSGSSSSSGGGGGGSIKVTDKTPTKAPPNSCLRKVVDGRADARVLKVDERDVELGVVVASLPLRSRGLGDALWLEPCKVPRRRRLGLNERTRVEDVCV